MRIGYSVEGSADRALIKGLKKLWCPSADLIEGHFRGETHLSLRREFSKICAEFSLKGTDVMVFLTDSNGRSWREVQREERNKFPPAHLAQAIHGIADRNVECWFCADADWLARRLGCQPADLRSEDPSGSFRGAMRITRDDRQEPEIVALVKEAPLSAWLRNPSFEDFYDQIWQFSRRFGCSVENLRARQP